MAETRSAGGGEGRWLQEFWVWPLPPEGPLAFVCEWPAAQIAETRTEVDSALVRDAAVEAVVLWPDTGTGSDSGGWTSYATQHVRLTPSPAELPDPDDPAAS